MFDRIYLDPVAKGVVLALLSVAVATLGAAFFLSTLPAASPELLRTVALIGAALVIAFAVEATWLAERVGQGDEYEEWLGFIAGAGIAGLIGVVVSLLVAEHLAAGHESLIDDIGVAWSTVSLTILGVVIVIQPLLANRFRVD